MLVYTVSDGRAHKTVAFSRQHQRSIDRPVLGSSTQKRFTLAPFCDAFHTRRRRRLLKRMDVCAAAATESFIPHTTAAAPSRDLGSPPPQPPPILIALIKLLSRATMAPRVPEDK